MTLTLPASPGVWDLTVGDNSLPLGPFTVTTNDNRNPGWQIQALDPTNNGHMKTNANAGGNIYTLADSVKLTCPTNDNNYWGSGGVNCAHNGNLETLSTSEVPVAVGVTAGTFSPVATLHQHIEPTDVSAAGYKISIEFDAVA
jgi:hypothetical protein